MSNHVFPDLPGVDVKVERAQSYSTTTLRAASGKEVRVAWRSSGNPIVRYRMRFNLLRSGVNCTVSPWTSYSELALVKYFHATHLGSADSFLMADPDGGAQVRVHFVSDELALRQILPGMWEGEMMVETAL